jgi:hypothetical protein
MPVETLSSVEDEIVNPNQDMIKEIFIYEEVEKINNQGFTEKIRLIINALLMKIINLICCRNEKII